MKKMKKIIAGLLIGLTMLILSSLAVNAEETVELRLGEMREMSITESAVRSLVWQSSNPGIVSCSGSSFESAGSPFERIYTCDFIANTQGEADVTVIDEFTNTLIQTFHVIVLKYNDIQCVNANFEISVSSAINQTYTISCLDGSSISSVLTGTNTTTIGSYTRYGKTYSVSISNTGEHVLDIQGSAGASLTYFVNIIPHNWNEGVASSPATCTEEGVNVYTCARCAATREEIVPALGHKYADSWTIDMEPTCISTGIKSRHCERCDSQIDILDIPTTEHIAGEWEVLIPETCTTDGKKIKKCITCNRTIVEENIPAVGHIAGEWEEEKAASCTTDGKKVKKCTVCQNILEEKNIISQGHEWDSSLMLDTEATCMAEGQKSIHCKKCSAQKDIVIIPALGHSFGEWTVTKRATCTSKGSSSRLCKRCGEAQTKEIAATGHTPGLWETVQEETVLEEGLRTQNCSVCGTVLASEIIAKKTAFVKLNAKLLPMQLSKSTTALKISSYSEGDSVSGWTSSKPSIVSVNKRTGKLKAKKVGTAKIAVTMKSGAKATCTVKVQKGIVKTTKINASKKSVVLKRGKSYTVKITRIPVTSTDKIKYSSSNNKIATVNSKGKITAKRKGKATITVMSGKKKAIIKITVK